MADEGGLTREQIQQVSEYIDRGLRTTRNRMQALGMGEDALLDPDEALERQVTKLRALYLEAEKSALPFDSSDDHFWRMLQVRLQSVVLAYSTHEKFIQGLDQEGLELRSDLLLDLYRERLNNAARFRQIFFELDDRVNQEGVQDASKESVQKTISQPPPIRLAPDPATVIPVSYTQDRQHKVADDAAGIQGNVLKMLERQLRDLEKAFKKKEESLKLAGEEMLQLKDVIQEKDARLASHEKKLAQLEENNKVLQLALDAAQREAGQAGVAQKDASSKSGKAAPETRVASRERLLDSDRKELVARIDAMEQELATTSDAAYNAFMASSDLGIVILFMLSSFRCQSEEHLSQEMVRSISTFGVKVVVGMRTAAGMVYAGSSGADLSLKVLLEENVDRGPLVEGSYLMLFERDCWVLVQDPPLQDEDRYARLKDNLATLLRGAEARHEAITAAVAVQRQKLQVEQLILRSHEVFQTFEKNSARQQDRIGRALNMFAQDLRKAMGIPAGDQASIRLNMELKKLEDGLRGLFKASELIDPAFAKNIARVAQGLQAKQKGDA